MGQASKYSVLVQCWVNVADAGPPLNQHIDNVYILWAVDTVDTVAVGCEVVILGHGRAVNGRSQHCLPRKHETFN